MLYQLSYISSKLSTTLRRSLTKGVLFISGFRCAPPQLSYISPLNQSRPKKENCAAYKRAANAQNILPHRRQLPYGEVFVDCVPVESLRAQYLPILRRASYTFQAPLIWSWRRDLNPRPSDYKSDALPTELRQQTTFPDTTGQR